jgi:hypothetical protein
MLGGRSADDQRRGIALPQHLVAAVLDGNLLVIQCLCTEQDEKAGVRSRAALALRKQLCAASSRPRSRAMQPLWRGSPSFLLIDAIEMLSTQ